ncbi:MAG: TonB-dependent receptor [Dysgonamonadaceae bacterium]|nr:TonB-dependent receptor [Dysgonamonadaceae bacterium]
MKRKLMLFMSLLLISIGLATAQSQVRGVVVDNTGEPVIGATILIKGTSQGTITDFDGNFALTVPANARLVISYVGMNTQEVAATPNMRIVLSLDAELLDEVIVVAYGTTTKGAYTGSAAVVDAKTIEKRQVSNISNALAGASSGVQVLNANGQPGTSATIRIRGVGSINAEMDPLYVVDGIPYDGDLSSLNAADIESMTVLKDAASTSLYGARGANGIIMITTKKGKAGAAKISFNSRIGVNSRAVKNYNVLESVQGYLEKSYEAIYNAGIYNLNQSPLDANRYANRNLIRNTEGGSGYQVYTMPDGELMIGQNGKLNPNATLGYNDGDYYYTPDNWADETFQNNVRQEYNLSMSGANERGNFYMSLGYLDDEGVVSGSGFTRYSGRLKTDYKLKEWLKVGANVSYNHSDSQYPGEQTTTNSSANAFFIANYIAPIYPLYVRDAENQEIMLNNGKKVYDYGTKKSDTNFDRSFMSIANPAGDLIHDKTNYLMDIMNTSWFAEITPMEGLMLSARYGLNLDNTRYSNLGNPYMGQSAEYGGTAYQDQTRSIGLNQQYFANYSHSIDDIHQLDYTLGYDGYQWKEEFMFASGQQLYDPDSYYVGNAIDQLRGGGGKDTYATEGYIGRVNYSYDDKYFGSLSGRRDASSRFSPDNRWGTFVSLSGAWQLTRESFMEDVSWVDMLKFKASFGQQGNDNIGNYYAWLDQFKMTGADKIFSDGALIYKGNPDLSWETSTSYNIGFDFALFSNVLSGTIEYFGRKSGDMLYNKPVAGSNGYNSIPMNVGSMTNSGLELSLNWNILKTKDISWNMFANATMIKNKINELHPDLDGQLIDGTRIYEEGHSMYRMYLTEYAGVNEETGLAQYYATDDDGARYITDDFSVAENYKIASNDLLPKVYGGFGTSIDAFGFDASVQLSYQLGGEIYDSGYARLMHGGIGSYAGNNWHNDIHKSWTPENTNTDVPRVNANDKYANSTSTRFLTSSDYLSLNNITIGYTIPHSLLRKIQFESLRIYFAADNVGLITNRRGLDPRQSFTSATTARYTPIRTISGGLSLTF